MSEIVGKREKRKYDIVKLLGDTVVADNPKQHWQYTIQCTCTPTDDIIERDYVH